MNKNKNVIVNIKMEIETPFKTVKKAKEFAENYELPHGYKEDSFEIEKVVDRDDPPEEKESRRYLGEVAVDSGQVIIVDPCYLAEWKDGEHDQKGNHYYKACKATDDDKKQGGEMLVAGIGGTGVVARSGFGDGGYPVYATYGTEGRIKKLEIIFFE